MTLSWSHLLENQSPSAHIFHDKMASGILFFDTGEISLCYSALIL